MFQPLRLAACLLLVSGAVRAADAPAPQPRPVRVQTVSYGPREDAVTYAGTVQARVQANLGFRIPGKVTERLVDIGDHVTAGQTLARLDPMDSRLAVEADTQAVKAAEADAVNARAEFARYQRLGHNSPAWIASEFDRRQAVMDGAEAKLAQAERQVAVARDQLAYTVLLADADGVITDLKLEPGQVVAAGQTVISLAHTAETEIVVDVPENRLPMIRAASSIGIRLWSDPDREHPGKVREIGALADASSRTFAVKVTVVEPAAEDVRLGMTAAVRFGRALAQPVARLPAASVVSVDGKPSVWLLDSASHHATARPVTIVSWLGDGEVTVSDGVRDGDVVITAGAALVDAAMPVVAWAGAIR